MKTILPATVAVIILVIFLFTWWGSIEPDVFDVTEEAQSHSGVENIKSLPEGYIYTSTLARLGETLLEKNGGYITNDPFFSLLMDNMPAWEAGALLVLRDAVSALRNHLARSQSQSKENKNLAKAEPYFYFDANSWILPETEGEYNKGVNELHRYLADLADRNSSKANFFARADNLGQYLQVVEKRMGDISHRLSLSAVQEIEVKKESSFAADDRQYPVKTPWLEVDNIFYEARGATWAFLHIFKAMRIDFKDTLESKGALVTVDQIIDELENAQAETWSPVVLNGGGFGIWANYSLTMANYVAHANANTIDLRELLIKG
ncbi:MAG: DUF2333 family protein [Gammaproteobacteria bacterium]|nr:DUF2333 family protein [Gammaproteobacteria bacterium]